MNAAFTAEAWIYQTVGGTAVMMGVGGGAASWSTTNGHEWLILPNLSNTFYFQYNNSGSVAQLTTTNPPLNQWNHIAIGYNGTTLSVWINGVRSINGAVSITLPTTRNIFRVGSTPAGDAIFTGYISNVRIVKGTDVYGVANTTITVPTAPLSAIANTNLLLNFTNAGIFDNAAKNNLITVGSAQVSSAQIKFGTGSMLFNGTTDYPTSPDSESWNFGTGNFTVEFWTYLTTSTAQQIFVGQWSGTTGGNGLSWVITTSNDANRYVRYLLSSDGANVLQDVSTTTQIPLNSWNHIAMVRSSTGFNVYLNGTACTGGAYANTSSSLYNSPNILSIGAASSGVQKFTGYIDDLRITKGVARYTTTFNPPTQAFPNN